MPLTFLEETEIYFTKKIGTSHWKEALCLEVISETLELMASGLNAWFWSFLLSFLRLPINFSSRFSCLAFS